MKQQHYRQATPGPPPPLQILQPRSQSPLQFLRTPQLAQSTCSPVELQEIAQQSIQFAQAQRDRGDGGRVSGMPPQQVRIKRRTGRDIHLNKVALINATREAGISQPVPKRMKLVHNSNLQDVPAQPLPNAPPPPAKIVPFDQFRATLLDRALLKRRQRAEAVYGIQPGFELLHATSPHVKVAPSILGRCLPYKIMDACALRRLSAMVTNNAPPSLSESLPLIPRVDKGKGREIVPPSPMSSGAPAATPAESQEDEAAWRWLEVDSIASGSRSESSALVHEGPNMTSPSTADQSWEVWNNPVKEEACLLDLIAEIPPEPVLEAIPKTEESSPQLVICESVASNELPTEEPFKAPDSDEEVRNPEEDATYAFLSGCLQPDVFEDLVASNEDPTEGASGATTNQNPRPTVTST
ncbi:hypothetical protein M422DRAFT_784692 [Sphaerobolus stellatus SS14]|uniref:Uncharacterized protein n=1 Tax=Sphaerobolus stellatus (strain SS14) TaxID=990650 RepID=A0A0C9UG71_SPHS4|nr:hypothetical protein M422DRAFT_784692 [Sphaerobolus stellatus SS14]